MRRYLSRANLIQENKLLVLKTNNFEKGNRNGTNAGKGRDIQKSICREEIVIEKKPVTGTRQVPEETSSGIA